jgi:hypothetical protein
MRSERGAVLIHVAFIMLGLFLFSALSVDYGLFWTARRQAQNTADAAALAGATARAYDDTSSNPSTTSGPVWTATTNTARNNLIWGQTVFPDQVAVSYACPDGTGRCVKADVFRDGTHTSAPLNTIFLRLIGQTTQEVKASATAKVMAGDFTSCLKPWLIPDRWIEGTAPATEFNPPGDTYIKPGYTLDNIGDIVTLKQGDPANAISPSDFYIIGDANEYPENILGCNLSGGLGDTVDVKPGNMVGPTRMSTQDLIDLDPYAVWNPSTKKIEGGCSPNCPGASPRLVTIGMFDPEQFEAQKRQSGSFPIDIVNLMGFFVQSVDNGSNVTGVLVGKAGELKGGGGTPEETAAFLTVIVLIR